MAYSPKLGRLRGTRNLDAPYQTPSNIWQKIGALSAATAAVFVPLAVVIVGQHYTSSQKEREVQGEFVKLSVDILRQQPNAETFALREWATDVIDNYSGVPLGRQAKEDLIKRIPLGERETIAKFLRGLSVSTLREAKYYVVGGQSVSLLLLADFKPFNHRPNTNCEIRAVLDGKELFRFRLEPGVQQLRELDLGDGEALRDKEMRLEGICEAASGLLDLKLALRGGSQDSLFGEQAVVRFQSAPNFYAYRVRFSTVPV